LCPAYFGGVFLHFQFSHSSSLCFVLRLSGFTRMRTVWHCSTIYTNSSHSCTFFCFCDVSQTGSMLSLIVNRLECHLKINSPNLLDIGWIMSGYNLSILIDRNCISSIFTETLKTKKLQHTSLIDVSKTLTMIFKNNMCNHKHCHVRFC